MSQRADVLHLVEATVAATGRLDFAFNNAGVLKLGKPESVTDED